MSDVGKEGIVGLPGAKVFKFVLVTLRLRHRLQPRSLSTGAAGALDSKAERGSACGPQTAQKTRGQLAILV
jgi:hypothetical protein